MIRGPVVSGVSSILRGGKGQVAMYYKCVMGNYAKLMKQSNGNEVALLVPGLEPSH